LLALGRGRCGDGDGGCRESGESDDFHVVSGG
jgi:hypothetical protein